MIEDSEIHKVSIWRNPRIYLTTLISLLIGGGGGYLISNYERNKEKVVLEERISHLNNDLEKVYKKLIEKSVLTKAALIDLYEEKERLAEDYSVLENTLEKKVQEIGLTKTKLDNALNRLDNALKEKTGVEKEYSVLENKLYEAETLITFLESTITQKDESYNQLHESFNKIQRTVSEQSTHITSLNKDLGNLTKEYSATEDRLDSLLEEKRFVEESYALSLTESQDEISRLKKYISDIIKIYGLGENPLDISTITIKENSNWWDCTEAKIEERVGKEIDDQLRKNRYSSPWGIYIFNKATEVRKNFPKQPEESQQRLKNLNFVKREDQFNVYLGDMNEVKE